MTAMRLKTRRAPPTDNPILSLGLSRYDSPHQILQREPLVSSRDINALRLGEAFIKMREYDYQKVRFRKFER